MQETDATDSICPKGWEMARSKAGEGIVYSLFINYGIKMSSYVDSIYQPSSGTRHMDTSIIILPLSYMRSGEYVYNDGRRLNRGIYGYFQDGSMRTKTASYFTYFSQNLLAPISGNQKGRGRPFRCVAKCVVKMT